MNTAILFKPIEKDDLDKLQSYRNDDRVRPFVREYRLLSQEDQAEWFRNYRESRHNSDWGQELMIISYGGTIAVGGFVRIEWRNQRAELSFYTPYIAMISKQMEMLEELVRRGFHEYGLNKITWPVYSHHPNLEHFKKLFRTEAILKEEYYWDGKFNDRHYLSLTRKQFDKMEKICYTTL